MFRVAQEALTNVAKASRVGLTLSYMDDVVLLDVRVAGSLAVESSPGEGTAVNASVPALPAGGGAWPHIYGKPGVRDRAAAVGEGYTRGLLS